MTKTRKMSHLHEIYVYPPHSIQSSGFILCVAVVSFIDIIPLTSFRCDAINSILFTFITKQFIYGEQKRSS